MEYFNMEYGTDTIDCMSCIFYFINIPPPLRSSLTDLTVFFLLAPRVSLTDNLDQHLVCLVTILELQHFSSFS